MHLPGQHSTHDCNLECCEGSTWSENLEVRVLGITMELPSLTPSSRGNFCYHDHVFLLARMNQHPPAHHPLDARHYSAVDELELI